MELPDGWTIRRGAGGWSAINPARMWATNVYTPAQGGEAKAIAAAIELEEMVTRHIAEQQRLCETLRRCFNG